MPSESRIKRSDCLAFFFSDGQLYGLNYLTGVRLQMPSSLIVVLDGLSTWRTPAAIARTIKGSSPASVRQLVRFLEASSFVVREGSRQSAREEGLAPWRDWGVEARFFHFATKRTHQVPPVSDEQTLNRSLLRRRPLPPRTKRYAGRPLLPLPRVDQRVASELPQILLARRTRRRFGTSALALNDIALLLRLTWGFTASRDWPGLGQIPLKTSPSGGARHPIEVYLAPTNVRGLKRRVHYYNPERHALVDLGLKITEDDLLRFCGHQEWTRNAAALFLMTAVVPRVTWRYQSSRAYRVMLLECGHFCQTFCLLATWLRLAPFCTAALDDELIEKRLGMDGASETVLYAAGIGPLPTSG